LPEMHRKKRRRQSMYGVWCKLMDGSQRLYLWLNRINILH